MNLLKEDFSLQTFSSLSSNRGKQTSLGILEAQTFIKRKDVWEILNEIKNCLNTNLDAKERSNLRKASIKNHFNQKL